MGYEDERRTFAIDDREPVRGDEVVPERVHGGHVRHRRDDEPLAGRECLVGDGRVR